MAPDGTIPRLAVALVWLYQGLWCKLLGGCPGHRAIVEAVPWIGERGGQAFLLGLGALETGLALWVLSGWRPRAAALVQTGLLIGMNGGGLIWGREHIADPGAMITQNLAFLALAWIVAGPGRPDDGETGSPWRRGRLDGKTGPYTFDYEEETGAMVLIQGVRKSWDPQPVRVEVREHSFLRRPPFASETPVLANAFHLQDVPYRWERGVVEPLPREAEA